MEGLEVVIYGVNSVVTTQQEDMIVVVILVILWMTTVRHVQVQFNNYIVIIKFNK